MARFSGIFLLVLFSSLLIVGAPSSGAEPAPRFSVVSLTRTIHIPTATLGPKNGVETLRPDTLVVTPGATDEPPEGPNGFDVLENGNFLVTDPLRDALSIFDMKGKFLKSWNLGFAADSITVIDDGMVVVREASTGQLHAFDSEGRRLPTREAVLPPSSGKAEVVPGKNEGTVYRTGISTSPGTSFPIQFDKPGMTLLSIENLFTDRQGGTYVALEATTGDSPSGAVNVSKYVRRYEASGKLLCETSELPLNYYIPPVDELRIHNSVIYQLQTTNTEVKVNVWDTAAASR